MEQNVTIWHIGSVAAYPYAVDSLVRSVGDMLRIAKGHLKAVDETKKSIAEHRKRRMLAMKLIASRQAVPLVVHSK